MKLEWRPVKPWSDPWMDGPAIETSLTDDEAEALRGLAKRRRVVEIGTAWGYAATVMALGGAKIVVTIDPHVWLDSEETARRNFEAWRVDDRVEMIVATAEQTEFVAGSLDLVFVDGDHSYEAVARDIRRAESWAAPRGLMAFHDYGEDTCPGVKRALDERWPDGPEQLVDTLAVWVKPS